MLVKFLAIPEARDLDLDSPAALGIHRRIIKNKSILRSIYADYYRAFSREVQNLAHLPQQILELGSGGGFLKEFLPNVVTSDLCEDPSIDRVVDAGHLPFQKGELKAIFM